MSHSVNGFGTGLTDPEGNTMVSRRRPGRSDDAHPALIPLLRGTASPVPDDTMLIADLPTVLADLETQSDVLAPARGIMLGIALSVPIWAVLIFVGCRMFGVSLIQIALAVPILAALSFAGSQLLD
jgi:hypothetical protein